MIKSLDEIYHLIDAIDPVAYAKTRNHLSGAVTRLSPYITRGIVTLPAVRERSLARHSLHDCEKLIQELAWREYFQAVWWDKGDEIFADLRFSRDDWQHEELPTALVEGVTGVEVVDAGVQELCTTGYMHNHVRMWVASVGCNLARAHWYNLGRWLYYHLCDGDPASNFLSWQWVAGTSKSVPYTVNQKLINGCSDIKQVRSILTYDRDLMLDQPVPEVLVAHQPFTLATTYPDTTVTESVADKHVVLYTPWTLDPTYRVAEQAGGVAARHILVIDPVWFDRLPVSQWVMDFIVSQGRAVLPSLEIFVGDAADIPDVTDAVMVHARAHQTNQSWSSFTTLDPAPKLFPQISGYYKSFMAYWKQVETSQR